MYQNYPGIFDERERKLFYGSDYLAMKALYVVCKSQKKIIREMNKDIEPVHSNPKVGSNKKYEKIQQADIVLANDVVRILKYHRNIGKSHTTGQELASKLSLRWPRLRRKLHIINDPRIVLYKDNAYCRERHLIHVMFIGLVK